MQFSFRTVLLSVALSALVFRFAAYAMEVYRTGDPSASMQIAGIFTLGIFIVPLTIFAIGGLLTSRHPERSTWIGVATLVLGLSGSFICGLLGAAFLYRMDD